MERFGTVTTDPRKHAIILSGGGAKGAYEIGVMKALLPGYVKTVGDGKEIHPVVYTGTSVGSYNAAFMVSRPDQDSKTTLAELEGIWRNRIASSRTRPNGVLRFRGNLLEMLDVERMMVDPFAPLRNFFDDGAFFVKDSIDRLQVFFRSTERLTRRAINIIDFSAFVSTDKLRDLVVETIDLNSIRGNEERALVIAATNWERGAVKLFGNQKPEGELAELVALDDKIGHLAILASTSIPGVFPPVEIYHTKYVDGGLLLNTPISPALRCLRAIAPDEERYVVHVIYLDPDLKDVPLGQGTNTMDTLNRFTALSFASQVNLDIKRARYINESLERRSSQQKSKTPESAEKYKPLTIHRYHPRSTLGGILGLLAFESDYVGQVIELGFQDAVMHDCKESGCIFPTLKEATVAAEMCDHLRGAKRHSAGRAPVVTIAERR